MLTPEVAPQVNDLPHSQSHKHTHCYKRKPLDALIGALIRIAKLLLSVSQVVHFTDDLADDFLDAAQFGFDRLEFVTCLDGRPVLCISADINI